MREGTSVGTTGNIVEDALHEDDADVDSAGNVGLFRSIEGGSMRAAMSMPTRNATVARSVGAIRDVRAKRNRLGKVAKIGIISPIPLRIAK